MRITLMMIYEGCEASVIMKMTLVALLDGNRDGPRR